MLKSLKHPGIIELQNSGFDCEFQQIQYRGPFLATQYVGTELLDFCTSRGAMGESTARFLMS